jgi:glucose-1-phosphate cytidylyltransferase
MKVVLFCGGYGMRMREDSNSLPKPMMMIGDRPLLWTVMRYYAHFGHTEFILCLGYGAQHVKDFFLRYEETWSNDFVMRNGGEDIELLSNDIADWTITFVDTGLETAIGERLRRVRAHLGDDELFLANYADVLTDAPLDLMVDNLARSNALVSLLAVPPQAIFHVVETADDDRISTIVSLADVPMRQNGGYFVMRREIFDVLDEGDDLVGDTLTRLTRTGQVLAYPWDGFWKAADTVKERHELDTMHRRGQRPWALWQGDATRPTPRPLQAAPESTPDPHRIAGS